MLELRTEGQEAKSCRRSFYCLFPWENTWEAPDKIETAGVIDELGGAKVEKSLGLGSHKVSGLDVLSRAGGWTQFVAS